MGIFGPSNLYNGKRVARAKVIGVRTAEQTKIMATYNYGVYSLLVQYEDGSVEIVEEEINSRGMKTLLQFIEW